MNLKDVSNNNKPLFFIFEVFIKKKEMDNSEIILKLVEIQTQFRFLHWQTTSFAKHSAYGDIYSSFNDNIDTFVESCMGKHGRPKYQGGASIGFEDIDEISLQGFIDGTCEFLIGLTEEFDTTKDSDLLNLRDEMLGDMNKLKYLLTLK